MALDQPALLELTDALRSADGGEVPCGLRRRRGLRRSHGASAVPCLTRPAVHGTGRRTRHGGGFAMAHLSKRPRRPAALILPPAP